MPVCPCGSTINYDQCCGLYIEANQIAQTPEQLMRSRYTAYSLANIAYIKKTMRGSPLIAFNEQDAHHWAKNTAWLKLELAQSYMETPTKGFVEFYAYFMENKNVQSIHELSEFHKIDNEWFYVAGEHRESKKPKIARNSPCPCDSGKKFKNCHEK